MAMSRKDFVAIADAIKSERDYFIPGGPNEDSGKVAAIDVVVFALIPVFRKANPQFDMGRFFDAVGMPRS